ncbi:MAG: 50S ribosomal protein L34e [Candidatus Micrarchaeaceae archaeon]
MPKPMHRSRSFKRSDRITEKKRHVVHFNRAKNSLPHCAICRMELNGISIDSKSGGRSRRTNNRLFGGVLCANCTADVIKLGSRVEQGEMKLDDISIKQRAYVLQLMAH